MDFEFIDVSLLTKEKIIEILDKNSKVSLSKLKEIKKLEDAKEIQVEQNYNLEEDNELKPTTTSSKVLEFEEEIEFYLSELDRVKENELERIYEVLPVKKKNNYEKIVKRLILESIKNIKDVKDFILEIKDDISKNDLILLKEEIMFENKKLKYMNNYLKQKQKDEVEIQEKNNLIFIYTTYGNIRVLEELKKIDIEYYDNFLSLLNSIKDGTFKGVKRFSNNSSLNGFIEVRLYQTRIIFQRLDDINYAIITAFVKKTQNDKLYRDTLVRRINDYKAIEKEIKENLNNLNYIEENRIIEQDIYSILTSHNKEFKKEMVK